MGSGPTAGLGEIALPDLQPGSSIMPGKVNPVLPEATLMVCAQVIGNDVTVTTAGASGLFELNVMMPVMARNVLESPAARERLAAARHPLRRRHHRPRRHHARLRRVLALDRHPPESAIGYEQAAKVAKKALADGATIRETVIAMGFVERGDLTEEQLDAALDVDAMTNRD